MAAREAGRVALSVARRSDHREPPRDAPIHAGTPSAWRAPALNRSFLLLSLHSRSCRGCSSRPAARASLTEPGVSDKCGPWVVHDGAAGTELTPIHSPSRCSTTAASWCRWRKASRTRTAARTSPGSGAGCGRSIPTARSRGRRGRARGVSFTAAARDAAGGIYVAGAAEPGAPSVLGAAVTCAGRGHAPSSPS